MYPSLAVERGSRPILFIRSPDHWADSSEEAGNHPRWSGVLAAALHPNRSSVEEDHVSDAHRSLEPFGTVFED